MSTWNTNGIHVSYFLRKILNLVIKSFYLFLLHLVGIICGQQKTFSVCDLHKSNSCSSYLRKEKKKETQFLRNYKKLALHMIFISNNVDFGHAKNENENKMKLKFFREPDFDGECQSSFFLSSQSKYCNANVSFWPFGYFRGIHWTCLEKLELLFTIYL